MSGSSPIAYITRPVRIKRTSRDVVASLNCAFLFPFSSDSEIKAFCKTEEWSLQVFSSPGERGV
jgi:hypothetical protein